MPRNVKIQVVKNSRTPVGVLHYLRQSRNLANSFLFILPLLIIYEMGILVTGSNVKNAGDVFIKFPLGVFGRDVALVFNLMVLGLMFAAFLYLEYQNRQNREIHLHIMPVMLIESALYAFFFGYVVTLLVYRLCPFVLSAPRGSGHAVHNVILSLGAGVYEEILFRLILLTLLYSLFVKHFEFHEAIGAFLSIVIGALVFAGVHYFGSLSDTFTGSSFAFRFIAGIVLSAIFIFRGLGIAVYTHALYDVMLALRI